MNKLLAQTSFKNIVFYGGAIGFTTLLLIFLISVTIIGYNVKDKCQLAKDKYSGDCVEALISYLDDETNEYRARNSAIWALGELGDERALPSLKKYFTNNIPDRESISTGISQYELKKAINLAGGGFNITAFFWKFGQEIN